MRGFERKIEKARKYRLLSNSLPNTLMLKGAWLEEWGFKLNMPVSVQCEEGRLMITLVEAVKSIDTFEEQQFVCKVAEGKGVYLLIEYISACYAEMWCG